MLSERDVFTVSDKVFVRKVRTLEGYKWEVVDDLLVFEPLATHDELEEAYEDAKFFAQE